MRRSGRYKTLNMTFGILPFLGALLLTQLREDSGLFLKWITIVRVFHRKVNVCTTNNTNFPHVDAARIRERRCAPNRIQYALSTHTQHENYDIYYTFICVLQSP